MCDRRLYAELTRQLNVGLLIYSFLQNPRVFLESFFSVHIKLVLHFWIPDPYSNVQSSLIKANWDYWTVYLQLMLNSSRSETIILSSAVEIFARTLHPYIPWWRLSQCFFPASFLLLAVHRLVGQSTLSERTWAAYSFRLQKWYEWNRRDLYHLGINAISIWFEIHCHSSCITMLFILTYSASLRWKLPIHSNFSRLTNWAHSIDINFPDSHLTMLKSMASILGESWPPRFWCGSKGMEGKEWEIER